MKHISLSYAKYTFFSFTSFLIDISLLWIFVEYLGLPYLIAVGVAFIICCTYHYLAVRHFVFKDSKRHILTGAAYYLGFALTGLAVILVLMIGLVEYAHMHYIAARVLVAILEGLWNFSTNYFFNFKAHRILRCQNERKLPL